MSLSLPIPTEIINVTATESSMIYTNAVHIFIPAEQNFFVVVCLFPDRRKQNKEMDKIYNKCEAQLYKHSANEFNNKQKYEQEMENKYSEQYCKSFLFFVVHVPNPTKFNIILYFVCMCECVCVWMCMQVTLLLIYSVGCHVDEILAAVNEIICQYVNEHGRQKYDWLFLFVYSFK